MEAGAENTKRVTASPMSNVECPMSVFGAVFREPLRLGNVDIGHWTLDKDYGNENWNRDAVARRRHRVV